MDFKVGDIIQYTKEYPRCRRFGHLMITKVKKDRIEFKPLNSTVVCGEWDWHHVLEFANEGLIKSYFGLEKE